VQLTDLGKIVRSIREQSVGAKKVYSTFGPSMLAEWAELMPPRLFAAAMRLYSRWQLAERVPPAHSVVVSNVAGSPVPLFAGDARLVAAYPFGPVLEGAGLNITVMSYDGAVDIGVIACPRAVACPREVTRAIERAVDELARAIKRPRRPPEREDFAHASP
jgi:hypothetical protein